MKGVSGDGGSTVGARVRYAMGVRGVGANELDRRLGVSMGYTSRLVNTDREPRARVMQKLAEALSVSPAWLLTGEGPLTTGDEPPAEDAPAPSPRRWVERSDRYPSRAQLIVMARAHGAPEHVLRALGLVALDADEDPGLAFWKGELRTLLRENEELASWVRAPDASLGDESRRRSAASDTARLLSLTSGGRAEGAGGGGFAERDGGGRGDAAGEDDEAGESPAASAPAGDAAARARRAGGETRAGEKKPLRPRR